MPLQLEKTWRAPRVQKWAGPDRALEPMQLPGHGAEAAAIPVARPAPAVSFAALLTGHILRDGEVVLLALKPSQWFIFLQSLPFVAAVLAGYLIARMFVGPLGKPAYVEALLILIAARFVWATLHWMGRWYVLTDQRVIRLAGIFRVDLYDCPLRKIAETKVTANVREQLFRLGSIEIHPKDCAQQATIGLWQTIERPWHVHEQINQAIHRAQCSG